jgi:hypothetical protein
MVSPVTVLRCGLGDLTKNQADEKLPTAEELFRYLEEKIPWLLSERGLEYEVRRKLIKCSHPAYCFVSNAFGKYFLLPPYSRQHLHYPLL